MLKIKDNINLKDLKNYGFKLEPEKAYYNYLNKELELFIWVFKGYDYKSRYIYIENKDHNLILSNFDILYDLIKADLVEKAEEIEYENN